MMDEPTELYYREAIQDELGDGLRLLTTHDDVYEAREQDGVETRMYTADDQWNAKIRQPTTDLEDAYDTFYTMLETFNELEQTDMSVTPDEFLDRVKDRDSIKRLDTSAAVRYDEEDNDIGEVELSSGETFIQVVGGIGGYAATGGAIGALAGPPGMASGTLLGVMGGMGMAIVDVMAMSRHDPNKYREAADKSNTPISLSYKTLRSSKNKFRRWKHARQQEKQRQQFEQPDLLEDVNELRCIEGRMKQLNTVEAHGVRDELQEKDPDQMLDAALSVAFHNFEKQAGVTATGTFDTYEDAAAFLATVTDTEQPGEQPSIYTNEDAFTDLFGLMNEYELERDQEVLAQKAHEQGDGAVLEYLETEHPDLFNETGMEYATEDDAR